MGREILHFVQDDGDLGGLRMTGIGDTVQDDGDLGGAQDDGDWGCGSG
ncbi:MAG: hypothetical protein ACOYJW_02470 [Candidatus Omnitrophota bacterium]